MKRFFLSVIFFLTGFVSYGQIFVGAADINRLDSVRVIEVVLDRRTSRKSIDVFVDYGQWDNSNSLGIGGRGDNVIVKDPRTKEKVLFKSAAAAINFFERNGWEHYDTVRDRSINDVAYYYFRRKSGK
jgi:hypothetical protein